MEPEKKTFIITEEILRAAIVYISTKPWNEVAGLMLELQRLPLIQEKETS